MENQPNAVPAGVTFDQQPLTKPLLVPASTDVPEGVTFDQQPLQSAISVPAGGAPVSDSDLTSNPNGQGVYQMRGASGNTIGIPYGNVYSATKRGYRLADDDTFNQFRKDVTADKNASDQTKQAVIDYSNQQPLGQVAHGIVRGYGDIASMLNPATIVSSAVHSFAPVVLADSIKQSLPVLDAYEQARSTGASVGDALHAANDQAHKQDAVKQSLHQRVQEFEANPTRETARAVTDVAGLVATAFLTHGVGEAPEAEAESAEATAGIKTPGLIKQIIGGPKVAQPLAQGAVRRAIGATPEEPLIEGKTTVLDDQLGALRTSAKAAYKQVDDAVGFDLKAEKQALANDQYKLKQLGNTDSDITQRGNLIEAINDSEGRITAAEQRLTDAGIDPKAADKLHQSLQAGIDYKKALIRYVSPDGESIRIDGLLNASKQLRFNKYGDRLSQFFGSEKAADDYMEQLQKAQELGAHSMRVQAIAKLVARYAFWGLGGYGAMHHLSGESGGGGGY